MDREGFVEACRTRAPSPAFVVDLGQLRANLEALADVKARAGARVLLALKGFAMFGVFGPLREVLDGVCASSPHEARLGREEFGGQVHAYAPAYSARDMTDLISLCDHLVFNSFPQWERFGAQARAAGISCGLRINPECSTGHTPLYDPCAPHSRLGIVSAAFEGRALDGIRGLHFHTLCEQNADALEATLDAVEARFGAILPRMEWLNMGGGHHITRADYDRDLLCRLVDRVRSRYALEVFLEPGEAVALNAGVLVATVLDVVRNGMEIAILDTSATAHMPDVLEMPYRPQILGADAPGELPHTYRLGGSSCLAGDVIGDYSFAQPLRVGDRLIFEDMAHYTMVKTTTFNGVRLPSICAYEPLGDRLEVLREFGYEDYRNRLS